jgi:hypothetical protein
MQTFIKILAVGLTMGLSCASAYADDASYCKALAAEARKLTDGGGSAPPAEVPVAISKCQSSGDAGSIATLEKFLKDNKATLPPRT